MKQRNRDSFIFHLVSIIHSSWCEPLLCRGLDNYYAIFHILSAPTLTIALIFHDCSALSLASFTHAMTMPQLCSRSLLWGFPDTDMWDICGNIKPRISGELMTTKLLLTNRGSSISHLQGGQLDSTLSHNLSLIFCFSSQFPHSSSCSPGISSQMKYLHISLYPHLGF